MGTGSKIRLLTVEDNMLRSLMNDPQIQAILPCLKPAKAMLDSTAKGKPNCNRCNRDKTNITSQALGQARVCVANARGATLRQLKDALGTQQLRILARNGRGQTVKWTL